jgi:hypothetical protein
VKVPPPSQSMQHDLMIVLVGTGRMFDLFLHHTHMCGSPSQPHLTHSVTMSRSRFVFNTLQDRFIQITNSNDPFLIPPQPEAAPTAVWIRMEKLLVLERTKSVMM